MKNIRMGSALGALVAGFFITVIAEQSGDFGILFMLMLILWAIDEKKGE